MDCMYTLAMKNDSNHDIMKTIHTLLKLSFPWPSLKSASALSLKPQEPEKQQTKQKVTK